MSQNQQKIDSLLQVLKTANEDTTKVNILNSLGGELVNINPDTSLILSKQALSLSEKEKSKKHIANSFHIIALSEDVKGNYPAALENNFKALSLREELADKAGIAKSFNSIGGVYYVQGDYPKALDHYIKALKIAEESGNKNIIATELGNIGIVYHEQKDYPKALGYYFKALKMTEEIGYKYGMALHLGNIGLVYYSQFNYTKALDYYFKALKMAEQLGDKNLIATHFGSIGIAYTKTGMFAEAEKYLKQAIAINNSIGSMDDVRRFEESLSQLYDTSGRYKLALEHYKKAKVLEDTLFSEENDRQITRMEMKYEFEKTQAAEKAWHEKQMAVAGVEIKKQKVLKYALIVGLALTLLLFFFGSRSYRARQVLRLQSIRNRIADDLHDDIGSTLNSISVYSEVAKQKSPAVVRELEQIGEASRKIIDAMSDIVWTINTKNDSFEQIILRLRSLTYNLLRAKNIEHTFRADESLNDMKISMEVRRSFYLIFKEALNNLVKYSNASRVSISLTHENNFILLTIRDNGVGFDVKRTSSGNGLLSMRSRAEEMKAELKIESEPGSGTTVELKLSV